jgi:hypothetical protein
MIPDTIPLLRLKSLSAQKDFVAIVDIDRVWIGDLRGKGFGSGLRV